MPNTTHAKMAQLGARPASRSWKSIQDESASSGDLARVLTPRRQSEPTEQ